MNRLVIGRLSVAAVLGASTGFGTAMASPANVEAPAQVVVSYADLNLNTPAGIEVMRNRLDAASRQVCGPDPIRRYFNGYEAYQECVQSTLAHAVDKLPDGYAYSLRHGTPEVLGAK